MYVSWLDAALNTGWKSGLPRGALARCSSVGFLAESRKDRLSIFQNICENGDFDCVMSIPRHSVLKIKKLGRAQITMKPNNHG